MHMAGISGIVNRAKQASHNQNLQRQLSQRLRNNGVHHANVPAGVHNGPATRSKNASINGVGPMSFNSNKRASSGGIPGGRADSLAGFRGSMTTLNIADCESNPQTTTELRSRQLSAHRRWLSRNKVAPAAAMNGIKHNGGHRASGPFHQKQKYRPGQKYRETLSASVLLYMGIGMIVIGLVITFVGVGDHAFQTLELQLIGPTVAAVGLLVCAIRVLICAFAHKCDWCDRRIDDDDYEDDDRHDDDALRHQTLGSIVSWRAKSNSTAALHPAGSAAHVMTFSRRKSAATMTSLTTTTSTSRSLTPPSKPLNSDEELLAAELARQSSITSIPSSILCFSSNVTPQHDQQGRAPFSVVKVEHQQQSTNGRRRSSSMSSMSSDFQEILLTTALPDDGGDIDKNFKNNNNNKVSAGDENIRGKGVRNGSDRLITPGHEDDGGRHRLQNGVVLNPSSLTS